ncbi:MAG: hypothetical protein M1120_01825 [Patescibacteria group bacterium]|nr:hypothetical protein [Patescibacteria group bacterium]
MKKVNFKLLSLNAAVFIISLFLNWLVQLFYYLVTVSYNPGAFLGKRILLDYTTGVIGDGLIVPVINVFILNFLILSRVKLNKLVTIAVLVLSLLTDFLAHFFQGLLNLTNWSMPRPFQWNFAGYWHMVSLFLQMTYLYLFFYAVTVSHVRIRKDIKLQACVVGVFSLMLLFLILFLKDNRWI